MLQFRKLTCLPNLAILCSSCILEDPQAVYTVDLVNHNIFAILGFGYTYALKIREIWTTLFSKCFDILQKFPRRRLEDCSNMLGLVPVVRVFPPLADGTSCKTSCSEGWLTVSSVEFSNCPLGQPELREVIPELWWRPGPRWMLDLLPLRRGHGWMVGMFGMFGLFWAAAFARKDGV